MRLKALFIAVVTASSLLLGTGVADAKKPARGCPPAFFGPVTFAELIERWPPPPELPDPEGVLAGFDNNGDGLLCVMELPDNGSGPINVIDNTART
jgi:hypothetical protein